MEFEDLRIEMKCKDFHTEVEEGLKGESLSIAAQDHAAGCRPCHEFNQKHVEFREWLTVCRKITAPKDFQFGVQRKIANAEAAYSHGWMWDSLKYIVPTTALAAIAIIAIIYMGFNNPNLTKDQAKAAITNSDRSVVNETAAGPANSALAQTGDQVEPSKPQTEEKIASVVNNGKPDNTKIATPKGGVKDTVPGGGSTDSTAGEHEKPKGPAGIPLSPNDPANLSSTLSALRDLGVVTGVTDRVVKRVTANTPAKRSGVKVGDVVESLNGNVLTVKRGGQTLQITLK